MTFREEVTLPSGEHAVEKRLRAVELSDGTVSINIWRSSQEPAYAAQLPPVQIKAFWDFCVQVYGKEGLTKILTGEE